MRCCWSPYSDFGVGCNIMYVSVGIGRKDEVHWMSLGKIGDKRASGHKNSAPITCHGMNSLLSLHSSSLTAIPFSISEEQGGMMLNRMYERKSQGEPANAGSTGRWLISTIQSSFIKTADKTQCEYLQ